MSQLLMMVGVAKYWRLAFIAGALTLIAAIGTYAGGQYKVGKLETLAQRYTAPVTDYAAANAKARAGTIEADLLESCKQSQIGTWLQTTDALRFKNPASGNRIVVELIPGKDFIDINGREISSCINDEIEDRQFDISSMTNMWASCLLITGLILCGLGIAGRHSLKKWNARYT